MHELGCLQAVAGWTSRCLKTCRPSCRALRCAAQLNESGRLRCSICSCLSVTRALPSAAAHTQELLGALDAKLQPFLGSAAKSSLSQVCGACMQGPWVCCRLPPVVVDRCHMAIDRLVPLTAACFPPCHLQLEPLERAQAQLAVAHAVHRLLQLFLQTCGVDPAGHASRKEQARAHSCLQSAAVAPAES